MFVISLMFVFEHQVDNALRLVGYDSNFVSSFSFLKNLYFHLSSSKRIVRLDVVHFHILDVVLWLSIFVGGSWLALGIIFIRKIDSRVRLGLARLSERCRGRRLIVFLSWIFMLSGPIVLSMPPREPLDNPEILFVLNHIPQFYFFFIAQCYYFCGGFMLSLTILLLVWHVLNLSRSNAVLHEEDSVGS
jgi:hypothetical protein